MTTATTLRKPVRSEFDTIGAELVDIDAQIAGLKERREKAVARFKELAGRHLVQEGASRQWPLTHLNKRIRVTEPEATPPMNYDQFMREIGPEFFAEVCVVKTATLDVERWNQAVADERATDSQLLKCLGEPVPRKPSLYVEKIPKDRSGE